MSRYMPALNQIDSYNPQVCRKMQCSVEHILWRSLSKISQAWPSLARHGLKIIAPAHHYMGRIANRSQKTMAKTWGGGVVVVLFRSYLTSGFLREETAYTV